MLGSLPYNDYYEILYYYPDNNTYTTASIEPYKSVDNNVLYFNIPRSFFMEKYIYNGAKFSFNLVKYHRQEPAVSSVNYYLGTYTLTLTTEQETIINSDSDKEQLSNIYNEQKNTTNAINNLSSKQEETTQAIENLENTITDSSVSDSSIYLPQDNSSDITQSGLNGIFTSIYNAFCTGQPQDIVFPIPFTNKSITLQPNYVRNMLSNHNATWIITLIEAYWWFLISRYIIKDITGKITKIKSGNIEGIEQSNIKGDML